LPGTRGLLAAAIPAISGDPRSKLCLIVAPLLFLALAEQLPRWPHGALHLPQRAPPVVRECVQRTNVCEYRQLVAPQAGALHPPLDRLEAPHRFELHRPLVRADVAEVGAALAGAL